MRRVIPKCNDYPSRIGDFGNRPEPLHLPCLYLLVVNVADAEQYRLADVIWRFGFIEVEHDA